jgi:hypothetical protein
VPVSSPDPGYLILFQAMGESILVPLPDSINSLGGERRLLTQFTPTLSTPGTLHTKKAVPPNCTVRFWDVICEREREDTERIIELADHYRYEQRAMELLS